jgi:hypothetical protein
MGCIVGMIYLTYFAYYNGNPYNAFRGVDYSGNMCGISSYGTTNYPYLYFTNPYSDITKRICVDTCPTYSSGSNTVYQVLSNSVSAQTTYTIQYDAGGSRITGSGSPVSGDVLGYDSYSVIGRLCVPNANMFSNILINNTSTTSSAFTQGDIANFITDTQNNWQYLLAALGFAIVVSFIFMFLLRCLAGCIVWCSLFGIIFFFVGLGFVFLYNAGYFG